MVQAVLYSGNGYTLADNRSFAYSGDTTICGIVYSKYCTIETGGFYSCGTGNYGEFTRMIGMKMYLGPCSPSEYLLYDWGMNIGDTMTVYPQTLNGGLAIVDSTYMMTMLNGQQRKYLRLHGTGTSNNNLVYRWIEGIGDIDRGFFPYADFEGGYNIFVCQKENDTLIWNDPASIYNCDSLSNGQIITPNITSNFSTDTVCLGDTTCFYDLSVSSPYYPITAWNWNFGDASVYSTLQNPCHIYPNYGIYMVSLIVTNSFGKKDTVYYPVTVNTLPTITCFANPDTIIIGNISQLNSNSPSGQSFQWFPGVGLNCTNCPYPMASPNTSLCYSVTVTDEVGCSNTCSICVTVDSTTGINEYINSNAFAIFPNPFSMQTTLLAGKIFKNTSLTIYNSFGRIVRQIKNISGQSIILFRDNLPSGLYFIRLTQDSISFTTDKLIIIDN